MSTEVNYLSDYWAWLDKIDPRLMKIFTQLDDENCSGRVGSRATFEGEFEYLIYKVARDHEDFITLFVKHTNARATRTSRTMLVSGGMC